MILRTQTISKNINHQLRKEVAMAYRLIRRSLLRKDISPEEVCSCSICEAGLNKPTFQWLPWMSLLVLAVALGLMCLFAGCASAEDKCLDPGLKPELKKACFQMEKVCQEIGCSVSIR